MDATIVYDPRSAEEAAAAAYSGVYGLPSWQEYQDVLARQTSANNAWSAEQAQKQMDYQERMSNTAHQREVADLKAAGLNPVLSAGGSGAASLTGAQANPDQSANNALTTFLANLVQSYTSMEMQRVSAETALATTGMYNATSELVSRVSAAASNYAANAGYASTVYNANAALQRQREQNEWNLEHPSSAWQTVSSLVNAASKAAGFSSATDMVSSVINKYVNGGSAAKDYIKQKIFGDGSTKSYLGGHLTIGNQYK